MPAATHASITTAARISSISPTTQLVQLVQHLRLQVHNVPYWSSRRYPTLRRTKTAPLFRRFPLTLPNDLPHVQAISKSQRTVSFNHTSFRRCCGSQFKGLESISSRQGSAKGRGKGEDVLREGSTEAWQSVEESWTYGVPRVCDQGSQSLRTPSYPHL